MEDTGYGESKYEMYKTSSLVRLSRFPLPFLYLLVLKTRTAENRMLHRSVSERCQKQRNFGRLGDARDHQG